MPRQIVTKEEAIQQSRERVPVHESRNKWKFNGLDMKNFYYRLVNLEPDNVARFIEAGYAFVVKGGGTTAGHEVDLADGTGSFVTIPGKQGVTLALMCLPLDVWQADQEAKEKSIKATEAGIKQRLADMANPNLGNYGPGVTSFGSELGGPKPNKY
jgi:hypothetical protein